MYWRPCLTRALFAAFLVALPGLSAQTVTGRVIDVNSGQPMASVQVFVAGSGIGSLTQQNGRYLLVNVPVGIHSLTAERIGYRTVTSDVTVTAGGTTVQDFSLTQEALGLDEIIVTGTPGGTLRRAIGNSVLSVQADDVTQSVAVRSIQDLMGGRAPGLQLGMSNGQVGSGAPIVIRGVSTFNLGSNPLIYVDGIRVNNSSDAGPQAALSSSTNSGIRGGRTNVLNDFNPGDIESIEIIKGPAAATLYGTEASAGVIQIITKRGATGAPQFDMAVRGGVNYVRDPAGRLGTKWGCKAPAPNAGAYSGVCRTEADGLFSYNPYEEATYSIANGFMDWVTPDLYSNGPNQSYTVSVRGGTDVIRYFLSGNYDSDQGVVHYDNTQTARLRANVSVVFNETFSLDFSTGYVDGNSRFGSPAHSQGGIWTNMHFGNGFCWPRVNPSNPCPRTLGFQEHQPTDIEKIESTRAYNRFTGSATLNFTRDWLSSRLIAGVDKGWDENRVYYPIETARSPVYYPQSQDGYLHLQRPNTEVLSLDWAATARLSLTDAVGTATSVGAQYNSKELNTSGIISRGLASPLSTTPNQAPPSRGTVLYDFIENKSIGFYVQEELSINDRIFLTGAVRFDDNSAFGSELSPETYPKVSATWTLSEESFWNVDLINSLRLRGAWGAAGRQPDAFAGRNQYAVIPGPSGTTALDPSQPGNAEVGPERSTELELGFDVALLDDRISGEFSWYNKSTDGALLSVPLPPTVGFSGAVQRNLGQIDSWGWEGSVNSNIYQSPAFSFSLAASGSYTMNEIKTLGDFPGTRNIRIGYPYPNHTERYLVREAEFVPAGTGAYRNEFQEEVNGFCDIGVALGPSTQYGRAEGGPLVPCSGKDSEEMLRGHNFPSYRWAVTPSIRLFNDALRIHALLDGAYGRMGVQNHWPTRGYKNTIYTRTQDNPIFVAQDALRAYDPHGGDYDADYWKLAELGLGYAVPESLASRIGAENASVILSAREVMWLWRRQTNTLSGTNVYDAANGTLDRSSFVFMNPWPLSSLTAELRVSF